MHIIIMVAEGDKDRPQYMYQWQRVTKIDLNTCIYQWQRVTEVDSIHVPEAIGSMLGNIETIIIARVEERGYIVSDRRSYIGRLHTGCQNVMEGGR